MSPSFGELAAGDWLMHDLNAFEIAQRAPRGTAKVREFVPVPSKDPIDNRETLIMRQGAIGDLLFLTPVLAEMRKKSFRSASLCCWPKHFSMFDGNRDIGALLPYPLPADRIPFFKEIISLENTMEADVTSHATDVFAKALGVATPLSDYTPRYFVTEAEKESVAHHLFKLRPNLVVQPCASVKNRNYPLPLWRQVILKLESLGWGILLFGTPGQLPEFPPEARTPFVKDMSRLNLTFRQSAAILAQAQAFVGVDSAFVHLCHALDIPAVGLYGPFDFKTRTAHAPKTMAISGRGECAPCSWHIQGGREFPPNKPCTKVGRCVVLESIEPNQIIKKVSLLKP